MPITRNSKVSTLIYADDIILYTSKKNLNKAVNDINEQIEHLSQFFHKWKIKINVSKCETICFKGSRILTKHQKKVCKDLQIQINNERVKYQTEIKYLGVTFTENLKPYAHIKNIIQKAIIIFNNIKTILGYRRKLESKIKLLCYKQLIRPILTYAFPAWSDLSSSQMEKLRLVERKILRNCTNIRRKPGSYYFINNSVLYSTARITRIDKYMVLQYLKFFEHIKEVNNPLIKSSADIMANIIYDDARYLPPCYLLRLHTDGNLFTDTRLLFYHNPIRRSSQPVYNTTQ